MIRLLFILLAAGIVVVAAVAVYAVLGDAGSAVSMLVRRWDAPASADTTTRLFTIEPGQTASDIGRELEEQGLIRSADLFRLLVRMRGLEDDLAAGQYELRPSMTTSEIIDALMAGPSTPVRVVTILEGWRAAEVARYLDQQGYADAEAFLAVVAQPSRIAPYQQLIESPATLEGYLFPDTYYLEPDMSAEAIAEMMVRRFDELVTPSLRQKARDHGLTLHQAVTLASIIEREAAVPSERRLISGVFHNRLRAGMPLQADPTVQYAVAGSQPDPTTDQSFWKPDLTETDLRIDSPYNTYLVRGLPPTPICNPGLAALEAAVDPLETDFMYFVTRGDGSHVFSETEEEHQENVRQVAPPP